MSTDLPIEIEQKIAAIPFCSIDDTEELQQIIQSDIFSEIFNFYKNNYLPDILKAKPEIYQKMSLYLTLTGQGEELTQKVDEVLLRRPIPTIEEFLSGRFYSYNGNATLYPYWRNKLKEIFRENSPVRKVIFSGSIGSGKSTVARKAFLYVLYRLFCYRNLRSILNIDADSTIANIVISMTLKQVYETNTIAFIKLMETMPCFQRVMNLRSFENFDLDNPKCPIPYTAEKSTGNIYFPDNIIFTCGSNAGHFTGYNVVNSFVDEINEKGINEAIALLNTLDNRFSSRFQGADVVLQSIVSSARTENSAMGEYIRHLPKNDPSILNLSPCLWEVKPDPNFVGDGTTFPVMVGNGSIPSKIITDPGEIKAIEEGNYEPPAGCILINVPTVYRSKFELQLDQSIQDIAGMTTSDNNMVFRDVSRLEDSVLNPEFRIEANIHDNTDILALLEPYNLFEQTLSNRWQFKRAPSALRYCHIDLSSGGDGGQCDTGVCILHKEWKQNEVTGEKEIVFVVDLLIAINAKNKVDLRSVQNFLTDLVLEKNIPIHTVSADQYQSTTMLQAFETSGCFTKVDKLSVDIKLEPYTNTATLIETGHVKVGKCPTLKKELTALVLQKGKVTRTTELKDLADVLVGAIWNAQLNYSDYPQYQYFSGKNIIKTINYLDLINSETEELADI